jgi:hypothetical protein
LTRERGAAAVRRRAGGASVDPVGVGLEAELEQVHAAVEVCPELDGAARAEAGDARLGLASAIDAR